MMVLVVVVDKLMMMLKKVLVHMLLLLLGEMMGCSCVVDTVALGAVVLLWREVVLVDGLMW